MATNYLDLGLMEKMCRQLAVAVFDAKDNIVTPFKDHELSLLDSALHLPQQTFGGSELYPTLVDKASVLYYALNKNHPFRNGNKRVATAAFLVFLSINNKWIDAENGEVMQKALVIAESKPETREAVLADLRQWISAHIVNA